MRDVADRPERWRSARPRASLRPAGDWYRIDNHRKTDAATVWVYDEIGFWGVTAADFAKDVAALDTNTINLRLNSPGGDLFDGIAIHNTLRAHKATVNVHVDGLAASAASVIAMAGDTVTMGAGTQMMIHDGLGLCLGNAAEMRTVADLLDKCSDEIAGFYARRAGGSTDMWRSAMLAESWYTGDEAVAAGLADSVVSDKSEPPADLPTAAWDLSIFNYAGREAAPSPVLPEAGDGGQLVVDAPPPPGPTFDLTAFRNALATPPRPSFDPEQFRQALRQAR